MNLMALLQAQAHERPEAPAIIEGRGRKRRVTTFGALDRAGAQGAALFAAEGVGKGDAVLVLVPMSAALYAVLAAVFRRGAVAVVLDPGAGRAHVEACCRMYPLAAFVGVPKAHGLRALVPGVRAIPRRFVVGGWGASLVPGAVPWRRARRLPPRDDLEPVDAEHPALLTFTSGSTGAPKAAVRTHGFLRAQHAALEAALGLAPGQTDLATLPVFALANLASGVTSAIPDADLRTPGAIEPAPVLTQLRRERPTRSTASPAFFEALLRGAHPGDLATFRRLDTGGAPVFPDLLDRLGRAAPEADVVALYGSTEAEPIAELHARALTDADRVRVATGGGLPAGHPVDSVQLRVIADRWGEPLGALSDEAFRAMERGRGEAGEIVVAGAHVLPGYLGGHGDAETKFDVDGPGGRTRWHRTGDAGTLDAEGRLWLLGRCAAAARDARGTLYPLAVEAAVRAVLGPSVRTAFVALDGRRVLVVEGFEAAARCEAGFRDALAWAALDAVVPVARIPLDRRHNAKVDYPALRALLTRRR